MRFQRLIPLLLLFLSCATVKVPQTDDQVKANLKAHISTLAGDNFEGREAGTKGEEKAAEYIAKHFRKAGLKAKGTKGFFQEFTFTGKASYGPTTQLIINEYIFNYPGDFYPLPLSANGTVTTYIVRAGYGIDDGALNHNDYKGKVNIAKRIFVIETGTPDGNNPHGKFGDWDLRKKAELAIQKGATGIIFINTDTAVTDPPSDWVMKITPVSVPVLFAKGKAAQLLKDSVITNCTIGAEIIHETLTARNVIGWINNNAKQTVVIGAHFDHLGYGDEGSLYRGEPAIHNGADDNASGTSALIELAREIKKAKYKGNNYLFIAFSGEEKGLLGSNHFVKHPTVPIGSINYMINMDMVGRLKPGDENLIILGTGTSPSWKEAIDSSVIAPIAVKTTESGVGPSDHTSFYLQNIPVLHFFSGTHSDYHKPSDDENKINYEGSLKIFRMIERIIRRLDDDGKLAFMKTKDEDNESAPKFKVTLGVVPDYSFEGEGMRIDGVSDDRPAAKAGLQLGDVVIQLGEHKVTDMMTYMKALSKFSKGETTKVKVIRDRKEVEADITF